MKNKNEATVVPMHFFFHIIQIHRGFSFLFLFHALIGYFYKFKCPKTQKNTVTAFTNCINRECSIQFCATNNKLRENFSVAMPLLVLPFFNLAFQIRNLIIVFSSSWVCIQRLGILK